MDLCRSFWRPLAILRFCPRQDSKKVMKVMMISPPPGPLRQGGGGWDPVKEEGVVSGHLAHSCQGKSGWASGARERLHTRATWVSPGPCKEEGQHGGLPIEYFPGRFGPVVFPPRRVHAGGVATREGAPSMGYSGEISRHGHGVVTVGGRLAERTWFSRRIHWKSSSRLVRTKLVVQQSCGAAKFSVCVTLGHLPRFLASSNAADYIVCDVVLAPCVKVRKVGGVWRPASGFCARRRNTGEAQSCQVKPGGHLERPMKPRHCGDGHCEDRRHRGGARAPAAAAAAAAGAAGHTGGGGAAPPPPPPPRPASSAARSPSASSFSGASTAATDSSGGLPRAKSAWAPRSTRSMPAAPGRPLGRCPFMTTTTALSHHTVAGSNGATTPSPCWFLNPTKSRRRSVRPHIRCARTVHAPPALSTFPCGLSCWVSSLHLTPRGAPRPVDGRGARRAGPNWERLAPRANEHDPGNMDPPPNIHTHTATRRRPIPTTITGRFAPRAHPPGLDSTAELENSRVAHAYSRKGDGSDVGNGSGVEWNTKGARTETPWLAPRANKRESAPKWGSGGKTSVRIVLDNYTWMTAMSARIPKQGPGETQHRGERKGRGSREGGAHRVAGAGGRVVALTSTHSWWQLEDPPPVAARCWRFHYAWVHRSGCPTVQEHRSWNHEILGKPWGTLGCLGVSCKCMGKHAFPALEALTALAALADLQPLQPCSPPPRRVVRGLQVLSRGSPGAQHQGASWCHGGAAGSWGRQCSTPARRIKPPVGVRQVARREKRRGLRWGVITLWRRRNRVRRQAGATPHRPCHQRSFCQRRALRPERNEMRRVGGFRAHRALAAAALAALAALATLVACTALAALAALAVLAVLAALTALAAVAGGQQPCRSREVPLLEDAGNWRSCHSWVQFAGGSAARNCGQVLMFEDAGNWRSVALAALAAQE
eukprot:gene176-biopygen3067